ncbi:hypothetical protein N0V93_004064 [Gnomoniopsis smithogilvyi]|uniref:Myb-like domain-containing protein n=1 Tax=Gnomoniopsis smithogilvyi TaxID=1191159 RepID=A0A9W9D0P8_9PEZI|nr:hypothetical protein N0V93_004064 [Gnomoniopsis smithogilvyi]
MASAIRALYKQRGYSGEVPLISIVEIVGSAVSSAVEKWNRVADPKNHVDRDWLRNCVCDLVGGAVTHAAFEENKRLHDELLQRDYEEEDEGEYLDPTGNGYGDMSDDTTNTVIHKPAPEAPLDVDDGYYGLQQAHLDNEHDVLGHDTALLPRHQIELGWVALRHGEAEPSALTSANNAITSPERPNCLGNPFGKRQGPITDYEDNGENIRQISQSKRRRNVEKFPDTLVAKVVVDDEHDSGDGEGTLFDEGPSQRKTSIKMLWTQAESDRLASMRQSGMSWDEVHLSFSNRTKSAIMNKYRALKDGERPASRDAADEDDDAGVSMSQAKKLGGRQVSSR